MNQLDLFGSNGADVPTKGRHLGVQGHNGAIRMAGRCERCGRALSDPASMRAGMGPICASKAGRGWGGSAHDDVDEETQFFINDRPFKEFGVILERRLHPIYGLMAYTNVPHLYVHHSPTGFEWGYAGSGPTELSLNLAQMALDELGYSGPTFQTHGGQTAFELAYMLRNEIKVGIIGQMPRLGGVIPWQRIVDYVRYNDYYRQATGGSDETSG